MLDELADFPMMRKCLLGIKRRAEAQAAADLIRAIGVPYVPVLTGGRSAEFASDL